MLANLKKEHEEAVRNQVAALQSSVDKATLDRKEGVEAIRGLKKKISELSKENDVARDRISYLEKQSQGEAFSRHNVKLESLQKDYQTALEEIVTLQASMDTAAKERKEGVEVIRAHKKQLAELSKEREAAQDQISKLQDALKNSTGSNAKEDTAAESLTAEKTEIEQERDAAREQISKLQAYSRIVDAEREELASKAASHTSALEEAHRKHTHLLEEIAKVKAITARKEHELLQRLRHLDTVHSEAQANATSLAQQLHDAKARHGNVEDLQRQLAEARQQKEQSSQTDSAELRRHISALGRQYTTDVADVEALRADMQRESEDREKWWRRAAELGRGLLGRRSDDF